MEKLKEWFFVGLFILLGMPVLPFVAFVSVFRWKNPSFIIAGLHQAGMFLFFCAIGGIRALLDFVRGKKQEYYIG